MSRPEKRRLAAGVVAVSLAEMGLKRHAQIIRDLVQTSASSSVTNQVLHRENLELRRRVAELEGIAPGDGGEHHQEEGEDK